MWVYALEQWYNVPGRGKRGRTGTADNTPTDNHHHIHSKQIPRQQHQKDKKERIPLRTAARIIANEMMFHYAAWLIVSLWLLAVYCLFSLCCEISAVLVPLFRHMCNLSIGYQAREIDSSEEDYDTSQSRKRTRVQTPKNTTPHGHDEDEDGCCLYCIKVKWSVRWWKMMRSRK